MNSKIKSFKVKQLKEGGIDAKTLFEGGFSVEKLKEGGFDAKLLFEGGFLGNQHR